MRNKGRTWKEHVLGPTAHVLILSWLIAASEAQSSGGADGDGFSVRQTGENIGFGAGFVRPDGGGSVGKVRGQGLGGGGGNVPFFTSLLQKLQNFLNRITQSSAAFRSGRERPGNSYDFKSAPMSISVVIQNVTNSGETERRKSAPVSKLTSSSNSESRNKSTTPNRRFERQNKSFDDDESDLPPIITSDEDEDDSSVQGAPPAVAVSMDGVAQVAQAGQASGDQSTQVGGIIIMMDLIPTNNQEGVKVLGEAGNMLGGNAVVGDENDDEDTRDFAPFPTFDDDEEGAGFDAEVEIPNIKSQKNAAAAIPSTVPTMSTTVGTTSKPFKAVVSEATPSVSTDGERDLEDLAPVFGDEDEEEEESAVGGVPAPVNQPNVLKSSTPAPSTTVTVTRTTTALPPTTDRPTTKTTTARTTTRASFVNSIDNLVDIAEDYDQEIDQPATPAPQKSTTTTRTTRPTTMRPPIPVTFRSTTTTRRTPEVNKLFQTKGTGSQATPPTQRKRPIIPVQFSSGPLNQRQQQRANQNIRYSNNLTRYSGQAQQFFNQGPPQFLYPTGLDSQFMQNQGFTQREPGSPPINLDNIAELIRDHLLENLYSVVRSSTGNIFRSGAQAVNSNPTIIHIGPININTGSNGQLNYGTRGREDFVGIQPLATNRERATDGTGSGNIEIDAGIFNSEGGNPGPQVTKTQGKIIPTRAFPPSQSLEITDDQRTSFGSTGSFFPVNPDGPPPPLPVPDDFGALQDFPPSPVQSASRGYNVREEGAFLLDSSGGNDDDNDREKIITNSGPPVPVILDYDEADEIDLRIMKKKN